MGIPVMASWLRLSSECSKCPGYTTVTCVVLKLHYNKYDFQLNSLFSKDTWLCWWRLLLSLLLVFLAELSHPFRFSFGSHCLMSHCLWLWLAKHATAPSHLRPRCLGDRHITYTHTYTHAHTHTHAEGERGTERQTHRNKRTHPPTHTHRLHVHFKQLPHGPHDTRGHTASAF